MVVATPPTQSETFNTAALVAAGAGLAATVLLIALCSKKARKRESHPRGQPYLADEVGGVEANPLVRSISKETDILHLAGPTSQKVLAALNPAAGEIPFLGMAEVEIGGVLCKVFRITFTGCMVQPPPPTVQAVCRSHTIFVEAI